MFFLVCLRCFFVFLLFFFVFSLDVCKGRISKYTVQISLKPAKIPPLRISSVLSPVFLVFHVASPRISEDVCDVVGTIVTIMFEDIVKTTEKPSMFYVSFMFYFLVVYCTIYVLLSCFLVHVFQYFVFHVAMFHVFYAYGFTFCQFYSSCYFVIFYCS